MAPDADVMPRRAIAAHNFRHHIKAYRLSASARSTVGGRERSKTSMTENRKTIDTLQRDDCRWPIGDPQEADFHFCGAKKLAGCSYCDLHRRMAFQPARPRPFPPVLAHPRAA
jgi:hypothetical protein